MKRLRHIVAEIDRLRLLASATDWSDPHRARVIRREVERLRITAYHLARYLGRDDYAEALEHNLVRKDADAALSSPVAGPPIQATS